VKSDETKVVVSVFESEEELAVVTGFPPTHGVGVDSWHTLKVTRLRGVLSGTPPVEFPITDAES
jgi:hypothetical protein